MRLLNKKTQTSTGIRMRGRYPGKSFDWRPKKSRK
jgi:hypothetical protein